MEKVHALKRAPANTSVRHLQRWLLGSTLALMPFLLAGARPWLWPLVAAYFLLGAALLVWKNKAAGATAGIPRKWQLVLGALLVYPMLQILPLPPSWIGILSPHRLLWLQTAQEVTDQAPWITSLSYTPLETIFKFFWWAFLAAFALVLGKALREEARLDWLFNLIFVFAGFEAFYGLLQVLIPSLGVLWEAQGQGLARGTFGNRNHYACFLGMLWPLLLAYTWGLGEGGRLSAEGGGLRTETKGIADFGLRISERRRTRLEAENPVEYARGDYAERERASQARQKQMFYGFVIGLMLLGIFFSRSRGGITASLISLTVLISVSKKMRTRGMLLMVAGCWSVMFAYGSIIGFGEILARFDDLDIAASGRSMIWGTAIQIIKDHLWTGTGLGSFGELFRVYQTFLDDTAATDYAHNDYLQLMVELGVPVAVSLFVLVWGYWWRTAWRIAGGQRAEDRGQSIDFVKRGELRIRDYAGAGGSKLKAAKRPQAGSWESSTDIRYAGSGSGKRRLIAAGALAGSAAFLVHSWVEFNWQIPADALYLVMLLVIMGEHSREL